MNSKAFEQRARDALELRSQRLDTRIRQRLERARRHALAAEQRSSGSRWSWTAMVGAGAAAVAAIVLVVILHVPHPFEAETPLSGSAPPTADLDLLTVDEFDLLTEDLEFFAWIAMLAEQGEDAPEDQEGSG